MGSYIASLAAIGHRCEAALRAWRSGGIIDCPARRSRAKALLAVFAGIGPYIVEGEKVDEPKM